MRRALVLSLALWLPACSRELLEQDVFAQPDLSGSVRIPLAASQADGTTYLLRNATVEIGGAAMLTLSSLSDAARDAITTPLPAGSYSLYLRPGFQLVQVDPSGQEHTVDAALAGQNPLFFSVRELEDATLKLAFQPGADAEHPVVFGVREPVRITAVY